MGDERANKLKVPYLHGTHGSICGGHKREGGYALPGEICRPAIGYFRRKAEGWGGRSQQRA